MQDIFADYPEEGGSAPLLVRPAAQDEWLTVARIHEASASVAYRAIFSGHPFPRAESEERWRGFIGRILIAEISGHPVGFVAFDEAELHALYLLPEFQGQGIGSRLLAAADGPRHLWVLRDNHPARRFYTANGWHPTGEQRLDDDAVELCYARRS
jgi:GNAT superfamily N-acetyltransferase